MSHHWSHLILRITLWNWLILESEQQPHSQPKLFKGSSCTDIFVSGFSWANWKWHSTWLRQRGCFQDRRQEKLYILHIVRVEGFARNFSSLTSKNRNQKPTRNFTRWQTELQHFSSCNRWVKKLNVWSLRKEHDRNMWLNSDSVFWTADKLQLRYKISFSINAYRSEIYVHNSNFECLGLRKQVLKHTPIFFDPFTTNTSSDIWSQRRECALRSN